MATLLPMDALATGLKRRLSEVLARSVADGACVEVALVRLLGVVPAPDGLRAALAEPFEAGAAELAAQVAALIDSDAEGAARAAEMLALESGHTACAPALHERIAAVARRFDAAADKSEETSVAAYSLGSSARLEKATNELARTFSAWGVIAPERVILQIGCGIGRVEVELAPRVRHAHGIDVSARMIEAARRRCRGLSNVTLRTCSGRDLEGFPDRHFDLVYAVDSFPYLFEAGEDLVDTHFREARRVLVPGGDFVIFNLTYRGDLEADRSDAARWARANDFEIVRNGTRPLSTWDAAGFHFRVAN